MLSLLLSALVLAWGTATPGVQHTHARGSAPAHGHDESRDAAHHSLHHHGSDGEHHEQAVRFDVSALVDFVAHLHVRWLGIKLSLPVPAGDGEENGATATVLPAIVGAMDEILPVTQGGLSLDRVLLAVISVSRVDVVADLPPLPRPRFTASIPLCDSARLERSGVLLV